MNNANKAQIKEANRLARIIYNHEVKGQKVANIAAIRAEYEAAFKKLG